jgi:hypothetical protein
VFHACIYRRKGFYLWWHLLLREDSRFRFYLFSFRNPQPLPLPCTLTMSIHVYILLCVCVCVLNRYPPMRKMFTVLYESSRRRQLKSIQSLFLFPCFATNGHSIPCVFEITHIPPSLCQWLVKVKLFFFFFSLTTRLPKPTPT